jgi:hypothetical protein
MPVPISPAINAAIALTSRIANSIPERRQLPIIGGGILDKRNDGFFGDRKSVRQFNQYMIGQAVLSGSPESLSYLQRLNPIRFPRKQPLYQNDMEQQAKATAKAENDSLESEGNIHVNGKLIPGIFQGFKMSGGINIIKFAQAKLRQGIDPQHQIPTGATLFQLDGGIKPFKGTASFVFLKDYFSTPLEKAREFIRIITEDGGGTGDAQTMTRVWKIEGFLIDSGGPFVASMFKIHDYWLEMPPGMGGKIMGAFEFEQFEIYSKEIKLQKPDTRNTSESQRALESERLTNPMKAVPSPA